MNYNSILVRYSEIHLKGKNRGYFEKVLKTNINNKLKKFNTTLNSTSGRYIVEDFNLDDLDEIILALTKTAGVYSVSPAIKVEATVEDIYNTALNLTKELSGTFRVSAKRADKSFPVSSMDLAKDLGGEILKHNHDLEVDLFNPELDLNVDIRPNKYAYIYFETKYGINGMPVSCSGKGLLLLSGGIDSPVAGFKMIKRGMKMACIHFESYPYTSPQAKEKAIKLGKVLTEYNGNTTIYFANIAHIQEAIHKHCHPDYMITLVRRFMLRIAERVAEKNHCECLVTGESLAQVASQTIESMTVIGEAMQTNLPLLKPLVGYDKQETIEVAKQIGSYDISIEPYDDCCTVFLPESPVIKPKLEKVLKEESRLNVEELIETCLSNIEKISLE